MPLNLPGIPQNPQHRYPSIHNQNKKVNLEEYRQKLQDPEFHQNLTKAHVYHAADLENDVKELDREGKPIKFIIKQHEVKKIFKINRIYLKI